MNRQPYAGSWGTTGMAVPAVAATSASSRYEARHLGRIVGIVHRAAEQESPLGVQHRDLGRPMQPEPAGDLLLRVAKHEVEAAQARHQARDEFGFVQWLAIDGNPRDALVVGIEAGVEWPQARLEFRDAGATRAPGVDHREGLAPVVAQRIALAVLGDAAQPNIQIETLTNRQRLDGVAPRLSLELLGHRPGTQGHDDQGDPNVGALPHGACSVAGAGGALTKIAGMTKTQVALREALSEAWPDAWCDSWWTTLGIEDAEDLRWACRTGHVARLLGNDAASRSAARRLARAARHTRTPQPLRSLFRARAVAMRVLERLERDPDALRLGVVGAVRRGEATVREIELLASAHDPDRFIGNLLAWEGVHRALQRSGQAARLELDCGAHVCVHVHPEHPTRQGWRQLQATGPASFVEALRARAAQQDQLSEDVAAEDERTFFDALSLPWVPPEARHRLAPGMSPAHDLLDIGGVRGVAGLHTSAGQGRFPAETMAWAAAQEGYAWAVVTASLAAEAAQADAAQDDLAHQVRAVSLAPTDVCPPDDGRLRLVRWGRAGDAAALAHAVARLRAHALTHVDRRWAPAWARDAGAWSPVLDALAHTGGALVLSGQSHCLPWPHGLLEGLRARGVPVLLSADAFAPDQLDQQLAAVAHARHLGLRRHEVLNTRDVQSLRAWSGTGP